MHAMFYDTNLDKTDKERYHATYENNTLHSLVGSVIMNAGHNDVDAGVPISLRILITQI